jgi:hypothetical protein
VWLLSGSGLAAVLLLVVLGLRKGRRPATVPELPLSVLDRLAGERTLRGEQTVFITQRLARLQAGELDRIRSDSLLLHIHEAGGDLPLESADEPAGPLSVQCAIRAGLIRDGGGCWQLTHAGLDRLRAILADETDRAWDRFVEDRLAEWLVVTCPHCSATQTGHWLRPTLGCPSCHARFSLCEVATVMPQKRRPWHTDLRSD